MICLRCGAEVEDHVESCWKCQFPMDGAERSLEIYPVTYEESGIKMNPMGLVMVTSDRLLFYLITDEMVKEEKRKIKGFMPKWEKAMEQLLDRKRFLGMEPAEFLQSGPENFALPYEQIISVVYKRSYFNHNRWATGSISGWRGGCLTVSCEGKSIKLRTGITGEIPKEERAVIGLFQRILGDKFEVIV